MKRISAVILTLALLLSFTSCLSNDYYIAAGWHCEDNEFYNNYFDLLDKKNNDLKIKYNIHCTQKVDHRSNDYFIFTLYNKEFSCELRFSSYPRSKEYSKYMEFLMSPEYGIYEADLYFYSSDEELLDDYIIQKKYIDFLNELTSIVAYDINTEINIFEDAYNHCIEGERTFHRIIYEDSLIGTLEYYVATKCEEDGYPNFEVGENIKLKSNHYYCRTLLKGTLENDLRS